MNNEMKNCLISASLVTAVLIGHWLNPDWAMVWVEDISPFLLILAEAVILLAWLRPQAREYGRVHIRPYKALLYLRQLFSHSPAVVTPSRWVAVAFLSLAVISYVIPSPGTQVSLPEWPPPPGWRLVKGDFLDKSIKEILTGMQQGALVKIIRVQPVNNPNVFVDGQLIASTGGPGRDVDDPRFCYRSQGWRMLFEEVRQLSGVNGNFAEFPAVTEILEEHPDNGVIRLDWYVYKVGDRWVNNYVDLRFQQMLARAMRNLDSITIAHVSTLIRPGENREAEFARARRRLSALWGTMPL